MKIAFAVLGLLLLVLGLIDGASAARMKTTVSGEGGQEIYNVGLIGEQQTRTTFAMALVIVGGVLLVAAGVIDAIQAHGRRMTGVAEKAAPDLQAMLRRLDTIAASTKTVAAPVRQASAKADADFDAAIAADMQPPRPAPQRPKGPPALR